MRLRREWENSDKLGVGDGLVNDGGFYLTYVHDEACPQYGG